jgi:hypothetical protein
MRGRGTAKSCHVNVDRLYSLLFLLFLLNHNSVYYLCVASAIIFCRKSAAPLFLSFDSITFLTLIPKINKQQRQQLEM